MFFKKNTIQRKTQNERSQTVEFHKISIVLLRGRPLRVGPRMFHVSGGTLAAVSETRTERRKSAGVDMMVKPLSVLEPLSQRRWRWRQTGAERCAVSAPGGALLLRCLLLIKYGRPRGRPQEVRATAADESFMSNPSAFQRGRAAAAPHVHTRNNRVITAAAKKSLHTSTRHHLRLLFF